MSIKRLLVGAVLTFASLNSADAGIIYGSLSNFDCINDTGSVAHGFEIELDGISSSNVFATFGAPYNRYGTPTITTVGGNTFVRYESAYSNGTWGVGTPTGSYGPTGGHALFFPQYGGDPNYPNVPGDHFGVALNATATNTIYHWLLDGGNGTLVQAGTAVKVPTPVLTVAPPANPVNQAAVQAVVQAPAPENGQQFGDAIWAKVFTTVVENAGPVHLNDLVQGNPAVPPETETEIEWQLLQSNKAGFAERLDQGDVANGNESVTRRYEFYGYAGQYDPENHEALSDTYSPDLVGAFLGNQNVAANFAPLQAVPEPSSLVMGVLGAIGMGFIAYRRRGKI